MGHGGGELDGVAPRWPGVGKYVHYLSSRDADVDTDVDTDMDADAFPAHFQPISNPCFRPLALSALLSQQAPLGVATTAEERILFGRGGAPCLPFCLNQSFIFCCRQPHKARASANRRQDGDALTKEH